MKEKKQHKKMNWALYVVGNVALCAAAFLAMPKIIDLGASYFEKKVNRSSIILDTDKRKFETAEKESYQEEKTGGKL